MPTPPPETYDQRLARTASARALHLRRAAIRALDDPIALDRAARIVRAALERGRLTRADLEGPIVKEPAA